MALNNALQEELKTLLDVWENDHESSDWNPDPTLIRMAEILETATNEFLRNNPDPMDDRHPIKSQSQCQLGHLLKIFTKFEGFPNKLIITYLLTRDNEQRNLNSARLLLNLLPGVDTTDVLSDAIPQLFRWAESSPSREIRAYSMGLLGAVMDAENAHSYRPNNFVLIPIALQRLRELQQRADQQAQLPASTSTDRKRRRTGSESGQPNMTKDPPEVEAKRQKIVVENELPPSFARAEKLQQFVDVDPLTTSSLRQGQVATKNAVVECFLDSQDVGENSNSSWKETMHPFWVGTHQLFPLSPEMEQRLILQYLSPTCEFQDYLSIILESHALEVVIAYLPGIEGSNTGCRDIRLLFDALKYISSLLIHRKFAWEFIAVHGVERLLKVSRFSIASTAVSTCLYYLAYSTDIVEKVCQLSDTILAELVAIFCCEYKTDIFRHFWRGASKNHSATDLAEIVGKVVLKNASLNFEDVNHVVYGNVIQKSEDAPYLARHVGLRCSSPVEIPAVTVNRLCGFGFQPFVVQTVRFGVQLFSTSIEFENLLANSVYDTHVKLSMAVTAENLGVEYKISRKKVDEFAHKSQIRWRLANNTGYFKSEVEPISLKSKKGEVVFDTDEHPRETTIEGLAKLPSVFKKNGLVTVGNALEICDGAAAVVLASEESSLGITISHYLTIRINIYRF